MGRMRAYRRGGRGKGAVLPGSSPQTGGKTGKKRKTWKAPVPCRGGRPGGSRLRASSLSPSLPLSRKIKSNYGNLPFAERWLTRDLSRIRLQVTLRDLLSANVLRPYYVLKEVEDGLVAQAEHTMIVTEEGCEVTTR
ncbi:hypothetical protein AKJ40_00920 [candidate division MSBL1 archaeon SCGC-AAA259M10]|uniref:Peptidase M24 domain-containing protein n=1 Tax=candidate division MSBL1 archaeon SCGC-AAA259M10 TaxID=1698270 RepID=A0A133V2N9_9EURY|nr:hypothetical protein AKJ40_00920 [candidate division MSBL1 archaeon SCGC-AAA259M10]